MPINNRELSLGERRATFYSNASATATGVTAIICTVPWPCVLDMAQVAAFGTSGSPTIALVLNRFIAGGGFTAITLATGTSNLLPAFGTSGAPLLGPSLTPGLNFVGMGSTLAQLQANDVLLYQTGGTNSAVTGLSVNVVLRAIQDNVTYFANLN